jgi:hypothetical protein
MSVLLFPSIKEANQSVGGKSINNVADFKSQGTLCVSPFFLNRQSHVFLNRMYHYNSLLCLFFLVLG